MNQDDLITALVVLAILCCLMSYLWYSKGQNFLYLDMNTTVEIAKLNKVLNENVGKISVLEKQVQTLSQEKNKALEQYHTTYTWLTAANQEKVQQDVAYKQQTDLLHSNIKELEEKMNLAIGNYQAERRRNLTDERFYVQNALAQLVTIEKNLAASEKAFTKPLAKGMN